MSALKVEVDPKTRYISGFLVDEEGSSRPYFRVYSPNLIELAMELWIICRDHGPDELRLSLDGELAADIDYRPFVDAIGSYLEMVSDKGSEMVFRKRL